jgi:hypothetical protein
MHYHFTSEKAVITILNLWKITSKGVGMLGSEKEPF